MLAVDHLLCGLMGCCHDLVHRFTVNWQQGIIGIDL